MTKSISNETLTAFLDGELDPETRGKVEAELARDPVLAADLDALRIAVPELKESFDGVLASAPSPVIPPAAASVPSGRRALVQAAIFALGVMAGAALMFRPGADATPDWKTAIANYQVLYVPETLAAAPPPEATASEVLGALSARLERDLSAARDAPGLEFRRAQLLGFEGAPLVQIAYLSASSEPVALCVTRVDESSYEPRTETIAGLAAAHWVADGFGFLVIGGDDLEAVARVARELSPLI